MEVGGPPQKQTDAFLMHNQVIICHNNDVNDKSTLIDQFLTLACKSYRKARYVAIVGGHQADTEWTLTQYGVDQHMDGLFSLQGIYIDIIDITIDSYHYLVFGEQSISLPSGLRNLESKIPAIELMIKKQLSFSSEHVKFPFSRVLGEPNVSNCR
jgi:hypothetical protein